MNSKRMISGLAAVVMLAGGAVPAAAAAPVSVDTAAAETQSVGVSEDNIFTKLYAMTDVGKILVSSGTGAKFRAEKVMLSDFGVKAGQLRYFYLESSIPSLDSDTDVTVNIGGDYNLYKESGGSRMGAFAKGGAEIPGSKKMYSMDVNISENDVIAFDFLVEYRNMRTTKAQKDISSAQVKVSDAVYTGKALTPNVTVTLDGSTLTKGSDYELSYSSNTEPGFGRVTVYGKNNYKGSASNSFKIKPKKMAVKSVKSPKKKTIKVKWKKDTHVTGYQIILATKKNFKAGKKSIYVKKNGAAAKTVKGLKSGKKYYVKVRSYKAVGGMKIYGKCSKVKSVKVK